MKGALLALLVLVLGTGCLSATWSRETRHAPLPAGSLEALEEGRTDLGTCLAALGAPLAVWEHSGGEDGGVVLAYGWSESTNWALNVSVPVTRRLSGSLDYDQLDSDLRGVVLFFDQDWILRRWRRGLLREAAAGLERVRRPSSAPD